MNHFPVPKDALRRKVDARLLPYLFALYVVAYLDRVNVSFAAQGLSADLGFSGAVFGLGAGIFFAGYVLFEVPSNLILRRVGARLWIARIMLTWGVAACALALVRTPGAFIGLRFLLGVAEAGFLPGVIYYLTLWYPPEGRARAVALFMAATPVAGVIGAPMSGLILNMHGLHGLAGWQWLFVLEGLPAVLLGGSVLRWLPNGPGDARWLDPAEREALAVALNGSGADGAPTAGDTAGDTRERPLLRTLAGLARSRQVWLLSAAYFALCVGMYGLVMWLPTLIGEVLGQDSTPLRVGLLTAVPYLGGAVGMIVIGRHSDATGERRWHTAGPLFASAAGFALSLLPVGGVWWSLCCFTVATIGLWGLLGPFWTIPTGWLTGAAAAGGVALINSIGNIGGFVGPALVGYVRDATGGHAVGFLVIAAVMALGGCCVLAATPRRLR